MSIDKQTQPIETKQISLRQNDSLTFECINKYKIVKHFSVVQNHVDFLCYLDKFIRIRFSNWAVSRNIELLVSVDRQRHNLRIRIFFSNLLQCIYCYFIRKHINTWRIDYALDSNTTFFLQLLILLILYLFRGVCSNSTFLKENTIFLIQLLDFVCLQIIIDVIVERIADANRHKNELKRNCSLLNSTDRVKIEILYPAAIAIAASSQQRYQQRHK